MKNKAMFLRWSINQAVEEFGVDGKTLKKRMAQNSVVPASDGKFSTRDIVSSIFGDIEGEKLRLVREQADSFAIKNAEARGSLIPAEIVGRHMEGVFIAIRSGILSSGLNKSEKDELLLNLKKLVEHVRTNTSVEPDDQPDGEDISSAAEPELLAVGQQKQIP